MTSQDKFEKWADAEGYLLEKREDNQNSYEFDSTRYAWEGYRAAQADQADTIAELETELKVTDIVQRAKLEQLQAWKDAAIQVESEWDDQAVGKALNIELGKSIRANILPKIAQLQLDNAKMREASIALIDRWNSLLWKDLKPTGDFIYKLQKALGETK